MFNTNRLIVSKTYFKYVLYEMLFAFAICFCFFFFVFFVNQLILLAREILARRVPINQVALLLLFSTPSVIAMSAPFASLVATIMTAGRLASDNEVLVLLSSGFSYKILFFPALVLGVSVAIFSFFTNDILIPASTVEFNKLRRKIMVATPAIELQANSVKRYRNTIIVTGGVRGSVIENLLIFDKTQEGERRIILAENAVLKDGGREGLSINLEGAFVQTTGENVRDDYDYAVSETMQYWVSNEDIMQASFNITPREMSSRDIRTAIKKGEEEIFIREQDRKRRLLNQAAALENALRAGVQGENWNRRAAFALGLTREKNALKIVSNDLNQIINLIELHRKTALPVGAFCFVFLAVSIGLMAKKSGQTVGFIFGVLIAVVYWCSIFIGQVLGFDWGMPPFWAMWLPNILCLFIGIILAVRRVKK